MKKLFVVAALLVSHNLLSQNVGIGISTPHPSALLDLNSTTQGLLVPRMTSSQRNAIASPTAGLLVFDTDTNTFWYVIPGFGWSNLTINGTGWHLLGNTGTDTSVNFIGTLDNTPLKFIVNNQKAGFIGVDGNIFFGQGSGFKSDAATGNIGIGLNALNKNTTSETVAIGAFALSKLTSSTHNTAIGQHTLENLTSGSLNTALGSYSLWSQTSGSFNTALGADVMPQHLAGNGNTAVGTNSMLNDTTGTNNTVIGYRGLFNNLSGNRNTAIGVDALFKNATGNNNLASGYKADALYDSLENASAIGALARVNCSNCMVLGSVTGQNGATSNVNVGIGINNPARPLSFAAAFGKKISLYPAAGGEAGFGVFLNELRIHSHNAAADISFGYDHSTLGFTERMRVKGSGQVGIGTDPLTRLHVADGVSGGTPFTFTRLAIESNGETYINLLSPDANETAILFGKASHAASGVIMYNNTSTPNGFQFRNNGNLTRMSIINNGNVGINTIIPSEKLEVAGNARANEFLYTTPKTLYYTLSGTDFIPHNSSDTVIFTVGTGGVHMLNLVPGKRIAAPVHLPAGAIMTKMKVYIWDASGENLRVQMYKKNVTINLFPDLLVAVASSGSTAGIIAYEGIFNFLDNVVDNSIYTYYISIEPESPSGIWRSQMEVRAVIIEYTVTSAQ